MVIIKPFNGNYKYGYIVDGHADYAEQGRDIVCASVSAITQTTLVAMQRYTKPSYNVSSGFLQVKVEEPNLYTNVLIQAMLDGLKDIQQAYNQYVKIEEE